MLLHTVLSITGSAAAIEHYSNHSSVRNLQNEDHIWEQLAGTSCNWLFSRCCFMPYLRASAGSDASLIQRQDHLFFTLAELQAAKMHTLHLRNEAQQSIDVVYDVAIAVILAKP